MTLDMFLEHLRAASAAQPVRFETDFGDVQPGYHVTELKLHRITGVDCGGRRSDWTEAALQIWDGAGGSEMAAAKLAGIVERCLAVEPGLGAAPVFAEFSHGNTGLNRYRLAEVQSTDTVLRVQLESVSAMCKPMVDAAPATAAASTGCCGGGGAPWWRRRRARDASRACCE